MPPLSQPGVYDFRELLFANNFQFLSGVNQVFFFFFLEILFALYCIRLSGLYCAASQVGFYKGEAGPRSPVSPPAYIETDTEVTIPTPPHLPPTPPNSPTPSLSESSKCVTCRGGQLR